MASTPWDIRFLRTFSETRDQYSQELQNHVGTAHLRDLRHPLRAHERARREMRIFNEFITELTFFKENAHSLSGLHEVFDRKVRVPDYYLFQRHPWQAYFLYLGPPAGSGQPPKLRGVLFCHEWDRPAYLQRDLVKAGGME